MKSDIIDFNSLFKYNSLINLWTTQIFQSSCCDCTCTAAGLHKSLYDCSLSLGQCHLRIIKSTDIQVICLLCFSDLCFYHRLHLGEIFILVTNFFRSNQVFLDSNQNIQLRTSHHCWRRCFFSYHSTRNFRNYFVSWGNSLFGVLDPVEQPAKFKCLKVNRQKWTLRFTKNCRLWHPTFCDDAPTRPVILHFFPGLCWSISV